MLTVACVLSKGSKRTYGTIHVERLCKMVAEHIEQPYRFLCLTNEHVSCESLPLVKGWPGWWSKIELFCPDLFKMNERVLYLDLDVTVTEKLDGLADYPAPFVAIQDWLRPTINSSVMSWDAGVADHIFENFTDDVMERLTGDQDWITEQMPHAETFPRDWCVSYRKSVVPLRRFMLPGQPVAVPPGAKVVVFHGFPKPWEVPSVA